MSGTIPSYSLSPVFFFFIIDFLLPPSRALVHIARETSEVNGYTSGQTRAESRQSSVGEHPVCTFTEALSCAFTYSLRILL